MFNASRLLISSCGLFLFLALPSVQAEVGGQNRAASDWASFDPYRCKFPERLVPAARVVPKRASYYSNKSNRLFYRDPTRANLIYGRGKDSLPTEIYAKAFDVLSIGGQYFKAPAAGEQRRLTIDGF